MLSQLSMEYSGGMVRPPGKIKETQQQQEEIEWAARGLFIVFRFSLF
jgi:hypothetical protein